MRSAYLFILLAASISSVGLTTVFNWVVDPLRYYHAPWFDTGYSDNQRFQNPGLVKHEKYDTVLIGTSHTEHFISSDMNQFLGGRNINLSISGSTIVEQSALLDFTLNSGKAGRVLWEINYPSFSTGELVSIEGEFPFFLYHPGAETPFRYLMSWGTLQESFAALGGQRPGRLDDMHRWDLEFEFSEQRVLANWDYMQQRWNDDLRQLWALHAVKIEALPALFDKYVSRLARSRPDVQFDLLLLPTSMLDYSNDFQVSAERFRKRLVLREQVTKLSEELKNVAVWDFQLEPEMSADLDRYKDLEHFDLSVAREIQQGIGSSASGLRPSQLKRNHEKLEQEVVSYTLSFCQREVARCQAVMLENLELFRKSGSFPHPD